MTTKTIWHVTAAAFLVFASSGPLLAGEAPTAEERSRIEAALRAHGFTHWGEIEREGASAWEVEDARSTDGRKYELKLSSDKLEIIKRESD
jgi:hypothetical protein